MTLAAAGWKKNLCGTDVALFLGALVINMLILSPICHMHYFSLGVVLVLGIVSARWETSSGLGIGLMLIFGINILCYIPPNIPGWLVLRDWAITLYPTLMLWTTGVVTLWKRSRRGLGAHVTEVPRPSLAA